MDDGGQWCIALHGGNGGIYGLHTLIVLTAVQNFKGMVAYLIVEIMLVVVVFHPIKLTLRHKLFNGLELFHQLL